MKVPTRHILLAEDNPINQKVVIRMLSRLGHNVEVVGNGQEAVNAVSNGAFDFVFMDMMMPVMDGITASKMIRAAENGGARIPIVALTANVEPKDERNCIEAGMDGFISKPFTMDQVQACLERFLKPAFYCDKSDGINPTIMNTFLINMGEGDVEFFKEVLTDFLTEASRIRSEIHAGIIRGDAAAISHAAHSLKASCAVLGAQKLAEACREMELLARGERLEDLELRLSNFDGLLNIVRAELDEYLEAAKSGKTSVL